MHIPPISTLRTNHFEISYSEVSSIVLTGALPLDLLWLGACILSHVPLITTCVWQHEHLSSEVKQILSSRPIVNCPLSISRWIFCTPPTLDLQNWIWYFFSFKFSASLVFPTQYLAVLLYLCSARNSGAIFDVLFYPYKLYLAYSSA